MKLLTLFTLFNTQAHALQKAYFAGGCFWCMEAPFEKQKGVTSVISGFTGGSEPSPSYKDVSSGKTSHTEAVEITFDEKQITYQQLLDIFWKQIDPTDTSGQFVDRGSHYRPGIFYTNKEQKFEAEKSKENLVAKKIFSKPIKTEITPFTSFHPAEQYHQDYYKKNPIRYQFYRLRSGRDQFLKKFWKK